MGEIQKAECNCGYVKDSIFTGFGMDGDGVYDVALCKKCEAITDGDFYKDNKPKCKKCDHLLFSYDKSQLIKEIAINGKVEYRYYCPSCKKFTLELHETGCWD